jgi:hypothetical protein
MPFISVPAEHVLTMMIKGICNRAAAMPLMDGVKPVCGRDAGADGVNHRPIPGGCILRLQLPLVGLSTRLLHLSSSALLFLA